MEKGKGAGCRMHGGCTELSNANSAKLATSVTELRHWGVQLKWWSVLCKSRGVTRGIFSAAFLLWMQNTSDSPETRPIQIACSLRVTVNELRFQEEPRASF
jgi:hypothetical protein